MAYIGRKSPLTYHETIILQSFRLQIYTLFFYDNIIFAFFAFIPYQMAKIYFTYL